VELQAKVTDAPPPAIFALQNIGTQQANGKVSGAAGSEPTRSDVDGNAFAAGLVGVAGALIAVDSSGKMLNEAAVVAAPHVKDAAEQRYGGTEGSENMMKDAGTAMAIGQAVSENPAARAAASTLFSAVTAGAMAAMEAESNRSGSTRR